MKDFARILFAAVIISLSWGPAARSVEWTPVGYGTLDDSSRFDVFIDTGSIKTEGGKTRFWQGHVFYEEQPLPSGKSYIRITIGRAVDCATGTDSNLEAVFYAPDGSIVDNYSAGGASEFKPVIPETISEAVLGFVCDSFNDNVKGGSQP
ncbi:MAG TPA: hypothetical protein PKC29_11665 [Thermodesulfobacteriota bacterium]|nr:hypothetical protein [Thermodesulfobacteriota bacterium]